jgi:adenosylcobyric acid synthase
VSRLCGRRFTVAPDTSFAAIREDKLDLLGDLVAAHIDQSLVRELLETGGRPGPAMTITLRR